MFVCQIKIFTIEFSLITVKFLQNLLTCQQMCNIICILTNKPILQNFFMFIIQTEAAKMSARWQHCPALANGYPLNRYAGQLGAVSTSSLKIFWFQTQRLCPFYKLPKLAFICTIVVQAQLLLICFWIVNDHGKTFRTLWGIWCDWSRDIEWFIENQAFLVWYDLAPPPSPVPTLASMLCLSFSVFLCVAGQVYLLTGERERGWGRREEILVIY